MLSFSPYSFRMGSEILAREDLENIMTLGFFRIQFYSLLGTPHLPIFVGPYANVLLQIVHFYQQPIEQQTEISSFVCGEMLVSH